MPQKSKMPQLVSVTNHFEWDKKTTREACSRVVDLIWTISKCHFGTLKFRIWHFEITI